MDAGAALFLFLAAVVVGGMWVDARKEAERQETLRRLLDKGDRLDDAQLRELLQSVQRPHSRHGWHGDGGRPGDAARGLRVAGTLIIFAGIAVMLVFSILNHLRPDGDMLPAAAIGLGIVVFGIGFFFGARVLRRDATVTSDRTDTLRR